MSFESIEFVVDRPATAGMVATTQAIGWNTATNTQITALAPTLVIGATGQTTSEDTPSSVPFTIGDPFGASIVDTLVVTATSSNTALVPSSGVVPAGIGTARTVNLTPVLNASGSSTITINVRNSAGLTTSGSFTYTVTPVNDAPVVAPVETQVAFVGVPLAIPVTLSDVDSASGSLTLTATSDTTSVLPASGMTLSGSGADRILTVMPTAAGQSIVTLQASDGLATSSPLQFALVVNQGGSGVPTNITLTANTVPENSATNTVVGDLQTVDPDTVSGHVYTLLDDAGGRFQLSATQPGRVLVADGVLLNYEGATSHVITVRAVDPDGNAFAKQLTIQVSNVNEAPVVLIGILGDPAPDRVYALKAISVGDVDAGSGAVQVAFTVLHGQLVMDAVGALAGNVTGNGTRSVVVTAPLVALNAALAAGQLTYLSDNGFVGNDALQVDCSDLGNTGTGGAKTDVRLAAFSVRTDPYGDWRASVFTPEELADPNISGPNAIYGQDGLPNLIKYALGLDPKQNITTGLPEATVTASDWAYTYTRPNDRSDLTYTVEVSTNLTTWTTVGVTHELVSTAAGTETWHARYPLASAANVYFRLKVIQ